MITLTKKQVQQIVAQNGEPLSLDKFSWDGRTNTFSSCENDLVLDFVWIDSASFTTGDNCTFTTSYNCTFTTGHACTFTTRSCCTFTTGCDCTFTTGFDCTFRTGYNCTFTTGSDCTFKTDHDCTFTTSYCCTFKTGYDCTFTTGSDCAFTTGSWCTFKTGSDCTLTVRNDCIIETTEYKSNILILRNRATSAKEIINLDDYEQNKLIEFRIGESPIIKDLHFGIKRIDGNIYVIKQSRQLNDVYTILKAQKIDNYFKDVDEIYTIASKEHDNQTYYAHGKDIKAAIEDLNFKITRKTSNLKDIAKTIKEKQNVINFYDYRLITGACDLGVKEWINEHGFDIDVTFDIKKFRDKYNNEQPWGWNKFIQFYDEYFNL